MRAIAPLPIREDWTPAYLRARHDANRDFAFKLTDAQGAPSSDGRRYHSGVDWFAPGGEPVVSPVDGRVTRISPSMKDFGQVFGGVVEIEEADGHIWVLRHVNPSVGTWRAVKAGEVVAKVTPWRDGGPHLHLEIWRSRAGGYRHENMIDPREVEWVTASTFEVEPEPEWPPHGDTLRVVLHGGDSYAGWEMAHGVLRWIAKNGLKPDTKAAISWRGNTWRGPAQVTGVARHLVKKYLNKETP